MKRKPKGRKYRNLIARGNAIYYERVAKGRRIRLSAKTTDWDEAAAFRDLYEEAKHTGVYPERQPDTPTVAEFALRYLREGIDHLAATTQADHRRELADDRPVSQFFGDVRLDAITSGQLRRFWASHVKAKGLAQSTGDNYVAVLSGLLAHAREENLVERDFDPLREWREAGKHRKRGKHARASANTGAKVNPIEDPGFLKSLLEAAESRGVNAHLVALLCLDAGLRIGEAIGLRWGDAYWGENENDPRRHLRIHRNRPRGGAEELPKSGLSRNVIMSKRLWRALRSEYNKRRLTPDGLEQLVVASPTGEPLDPNNFRHRLWKSVLKKADVGHWTPKDFRDSYASHLLTHGVSVAWVSRQLGHASTGVTEKHYMTWINLDGVPVYHAPALDWEAGEQPPDVLAKLQVRWEEQVVDAKKSPQESPQSVEAA